MILLFRWPSICWIAFILFTSAAAALPIDEKEPIFNSSVEDSALSLLKRSLNFLANQKQFGFTAELGFDTVQDDGQKIEFGARSRVIIQRPDRIWAESHKRNGQKRQLIYDGKEISFFSERENTYAIKPKTGTLDDLGVRVPLVQMGYSNFTEIIMEKFDTGFKVGESTVAGILCDHLTFRNDQIDFQIWVRKSGDPLPVRWIITYKNDKGQPQF